MTHGALPRLLGEILVAEGLTTVDAVDRALARQRTSGELIGQALVALGVVTQDEVLRALATQQDLPYLSRDEMPSALPVLKNLSAKYLRTYDGANASALQRIVEGMDEERGGEGDEDVSHLRDMGFEAPVVRLVNLLV